MARVTFSGPAVTTVNQNLDVKASVRVVTNAALPAYTRTGNVITASANGALAAVDSVTLIAADRLLVKDGAAGADNGIYAVTQVGTAGTPFILTRTTDADASSKVTTGMFTFVEEGTVWASTGWILTTANPITLNTTALTFAQFTGAGEITAGSGLSKSGNTLSVAAAQTTISSITAPASTDLTLSAGTAGTVTIKSGASAALAFADFTALTKAGTTASSAAVILKSLGASEKIFAAGEIHGCFAATGSAKLTQANNWGGIQAYTDAGATTAWLALYDGSNLLLGPSVAAKGMILRTVGTDALSISAAQLMRFNAYGAGALTTDASGNITATSDERSKILKRDFRRGLADVLRLSPKVFRWRAATGFDTKHDYSGFVAQNVQQAIPEAVGRMRDGTLTLMDRPILAALTNAIRELHERTAHLKAA